MGSYLSSLDCLERRAPATVAATAAPTFSVFPPKVDEAQLTKNLAKHVDLDKLRDAFYRYAGADQRMDKQEYEKFVVIIKLPAALIDPLWNLLDINNDGVVRHTLAQTRPPFRGRRV